MNMQDREFNYSIFQSYYGEVSQLNMAIEEMSELTKEICKFLRGKGVIKNIIEEIADVEIVIEQLKIIYKINQSEIDKIKEEKILKAIGHIGAEMRTDNRQNVIIKTTDGDVKIQFEHCQKCKDFDYCYKTNGNYHKATPKLITEECLEGASL